jgi:hypothetical protein
MSKTSGCRSSAASGGESNENLKTAARRKQPAWRNIGGSLAWRQTCGGENAAISGSLASKKNREKRHRRKPMKSQYRRKISAKPA